VATPSKVTEPATPRVADIVTEPSLTPLEAQHVQDLLDAGATAATRKYDPRKFVYVYDTETDDKLNDPVPETWLDGRFPQLSLTPSKKAGK
jgi:hypothetical protein